MKLKVISYAFAVCKIHDIAQVDFSDPFCFVGKTDEELSLVCTVNHIPADTITCETGWNAFRIEGILDFSLIGVLSRISTLLAQNNIGIFAVSTYNTDYILTKSAKFPEAIAILESAGYEIENYKA